MKPDYSALVVTIDQLLRAGKILAAQEQLRNLERWEIPRLSAQPIAALYARAGLPLLGIKLLRAFIHPTVPNARKATNDEKATYAACLVNIGAFEEAIALLREVDTQACPDALLFTAAIRIETARGGPAGPERFSEGMGLVASYKC